MTPEALESLMNTVLFLLEREQETTPRGSRPLQVKMEKLHADLTYHLEQLQKEEEWI